MCSELTIKTPKRRQWRRSVVFTVNFEHISSKYRLGRQVNAGWVGNNAMKF